MSENENYDSPHRGKSIAVIGAGVAGLGATWAALRRGARVTLIERDSTPRGASIRNFGMHWLIGQPAGERVALGERTRELWQELSGHAGFEVRKCGSVHLAHEDDEWDVLREFDAREGESRGLELLNSAETRERCAPVVEDGLRGSLWSPHEIGLDPPVAIGRTFEWIRSQPGVDVRRDVAVEVGDGRVRLARGDEIPADEVFVCSGADLRTLFPERLAQRPVALCKLLMMRTVPQPASYRLAPHVATGLSLIHYESFQQCPSLERLRTRLERDFAEYLANGIHVLATQNARGELLIGDSHHYGDDAEEPFDSARVEQLIVEYLARRIDVAEPKIAARWHGVYAKRTDGESWIVERVDEGVTLLTALGGTGMTIGLALAERVVDDLMLSKSSLHRPPR